MAPSRAANPADDPFQVHRPPVRLHRQSYPAPLQAGARGSQQQAPGGDVLHEDVDGPRVEPREGLRPLPLFRAAVASAPSGRNGFRARGVTGSWRGGFEGPLRRLAASAVVPVPRTSSEFLAVGLHHRRQKGGVGDDGTHAQAVVRYQLAYVLHRLLQPGEGGVEVARAPCCGQTFSNSGHAGGGVGPEGLVALAAEPPLSSRRRPDRPPAVSTSLHRSTSCATPPVSLSFGSSGERVCKSRTIKECGIRRGFLWNGTEHSPSGRAK